MDVDGRRHERRLIGGLLAGHVGKVEDPHASLLSRGDDAVGGAEVDRPLDRHGRCVLSVRAPLAAGAGRLQSDIIIPPAARPCVAAPSARSIGGVFQVRTAPGGE